MKLFLRYNKGVLALTAGANLLKHNPTYCKAERAVNLLNEYLKGNGPAELEEYKQVAAGWKKRDLSSKDMIDALEMVKLDSK